MRIFVTGATGFIGLHLVTQLAEQGHRVHALYRKPELLKSLDHPNITPFPGSLDQPDSLQKAMEGCQQVYHLAALAVVWTKDPGQVGRINLEGTKTVFELALKNKIKRLVFTSTAGVMEHRGDRALDESQPYATAHFTAYEKSKEEAEHLADEYIKKGLDIVIVRPPRVYGPGRLSNANGVTRMIKQYLQGKWPFIPGDGKGIGSYVLVDDVARGHILAMQKGRRGERYILGGDNVNYLDFFRLVKEISGKKHFMFKVPLWLMLTISRLMMFWTHVSGRRPLITPTHVRKFNMNWALSSAKAEQELDYQPKSLEEGLSITIGWLQEQGAG